MIGFEKPHIRRSQPYDGNGWICYACDDSGDGPVGYGNTPAEAYLEWANPDRPLRAWGFVFHADGSVTGQK